MSYPWNAKLSNKCLNKKGNSGRTVYYLQHLHIIQIVIKQMNNYFCAFKKS